MRSIVPGLEVLGDHVEVRHQREEQLAALRLLQVDADAALVEVVAQEGRADLRPSGSIIAGVDAAARLAVHRDARPSPRRHRGGRAAGSRTEAPASARPRARARRRAACRTPARLGSPRRRVARLDTVRGAAVSTPGDRASAPRTLRPSHARNHQRCAATCRTGGSTAAEIAKTFGIGRRQGHPVGRVLRRGHHHDGRRGRPARAGGRRRTAPSPARCGSPPPTRPTSTRRTPPRSTPRSASTPTCPRSTSAARCAPASARCAPRSTATARVSSVAVRPAQRAARRAPTSRRAATARPRSSSDDDADGPVIAEYLGAAQRHRGVHRPLARRRATDRSRRGRSGSAR